VHSSRVPSLSPTTLFVPLTPPQAVAATPVLRWPGAGGALVALAHGAGSGPDSDVLVAVAEALSARGHETWSFAAPGRAAGLRAGARDEGHDAVDASGRRAPEHTARLRGAWLDVLAAARAAAGRRPVVAGGRSMGGRVASLVVAEAPDGAGVAGLVLLAYPLVPPGAGLPPGRGAPPRSAHWPAIAVPALVVQGERDAFGGPAALAAVLPASWRLHPVRGADHGYAVRTRDGRTRSDVLAEVAGAVADWTDGLVTGSRYTGADHPAPAPETPS